MNKNFFTKPLNILLLAIVSTALWGSAIPVIKIGYEAYQIEGNDVASKLLFAGIRFFFAGLIVVIYDCIVKKKIVVPRKDEWGGILGLSAVQTVFEYIFFYLSLTYLSGVKGSILNSIGNFFAVILAHFAFTNDKLTVKKVVGCILGFGGVVLCCFEQGMDFSFKFQGDGFILIAAFCFALGSVITKKVTAKSESVMVTGYQLGIGGIIIMIIGLAFGGHIKAPDVSAVLIMVYLSLLSSVAFTVWAALLKYNPVGKISIYCFLNPVFGVILSGVLLGEDIFNIRSLISLLLVSLGIYIVNATIGKEKKE